MIDFEKEVPLVGHGPSNERLHDCLRLGHLDTELKVVEFWSEEVTENSRSGSALNIEIEGLHKAGDDGREWFFWGKLRQIDTRKVRHEGKVVCFVVGRWNTYHRRGKIKFSETSFFVSPLTQGLNVEV